MEYQGWAAQADPWAPRWYAALQRHHPALSRRASFPAHQAEAQEAEQGSLPLYLLLPPSCREQQPQRYTVRLLS